MSYDPVLLTGDTFNWNPATQLLNFRFAKGKVLSGLAGSRCKIACLGESTTAGITTGSNLNSVSTISWPARMKARLAQYGFAVQQDGCYGNANGVSLDQRQAAVGSAQTGVGVAAFGGSVFCYTQTTIGGGMTFTLASAGIYDRLDVSFVDNGGPISVAVDGGGVIQTISSTATGLMRTVTVPLTAGSHTSATIVSTTTTGTFIQGCQFWNSTVPAIEILNGGSSGASSTLFIGPVTSQNYLQACVNQAPNLACIMTCTNDINNGTPLPAAIVANLLTTVTALRLINCDVILMTVPPFNSPNFATLYPQFIAALQTMALANNLPIFDMTRRHGNSYAVAAAGGFNGSSLHASAAGYDDVGLRMADLLRAA